MNPFGNPKQLMKQLQQAQERIQKEIQALEIEATSGGGMVKVVMDGQKNLKSLKIDPEVVSKDDVEMLQDLVTAAGQRGRAQGGRSGSGEDRGSGRRNELPGMF